MEVDYGALCWSISLLVSVCTLNALKIFAPLFALYCKNKEKAEDSLEFAEEEDSRL